MKRDMELCRKILLAIEEKYINRDIYNLEIEDYSSQEISYHCKLLYEAGLVKNFKQYKTMSISDISNFSIGTLTWQGHDFLDKVRDETVWNRTKDVISQSGKAMTLDIIKNVATSVITAMAEGAMKGMLNI